MKIRISALKKIIQEEINKLFHNTINENSEQTAEEVITEPDYDNDCFISSDGFKYSVSCSGEHIGDFVELKDAINKLVEYRDKNKYWPTMWFVSDHGNYWQIDEKGNEIKEGSVKLGGEETEKDPTETEIETEEPAEPNITPSTPQRPLKVPWKLPGPMPAPAPKAMNENVKSSNIGIIAEGIRMMQLIKEAPMDIPGGEYGEPHPKIRKGIEGHIETPFSEIDLFSKKTLDKSALEKLGEEEYNSIVAKLQSVDKLNMNEIMNSFNLIRTYEKSKRTQLQSLALESVKKYFGLPDEIMDKIEAKFVDNYMEPPEQGEFDPEEEIEDLTPEQKKIIKKHVDKRVVSNALMMGAGFRAHSVFSDLKSKLDGIEERLYPLYNAIMPNMEIFFWKTPVDDFFGSRLVMGKSELKIDKESMELKGAKAEAMIFPILLHEVAKSAVELLFMQHLADIWEKHGEKVYKSVLKQSESYYNEHWMKLIGPRLWKYLHDAIDYIVKERESDYTIVSYLLNRLAILEPEEFMEIINDVLYNGSAAIDKLSKMIDVIETDIDNYENKNEETPKPEDIIKGNDNSEKIKDALISKEDEINAALKGKTKLDLPKSIEQMDVDELNLSLEQALEIEDYEAAAKIRDILGNK